MPSTHNESKWTNLTCSYCHKEFERLVVNVHGKTLGNYCSRACLHAGMDKKVTIICPECGSEARRLKWLTKDAARRFFCSRDCAFIWVG